MGHIARPIFSYILADSESRKGIFIAGHRSEADLLHFSSCSSLPRSFKKSYYYLTIRASNDVRQGILSTTLILAFLEQLEAQGGFFLVASGGIKWNTYLGSSFLGATLGLLSQPFCLCMTGFSCENLLT